ncbi:glutamate-ammonia-ligase adenylyltransferase [Sphingomonas sp. C8-2]|jgi:glutamate-ammonia-ligase adenylyltransferase|uniref:glutamate-ammonia-ligase adenylyltransferase n=1 Tax=Rhizorhabdus histidinilytica TaxID=439228 RepID=UPI000F792B0A|nr:glutamate-ammonia-ligase adenylyltransferase [Sphingomonas sp. C8-2]
MRHEPALRVPALPDGGPGPGATRLLAELERRCLDLRTRPGAARIDPLFARLDDFAARAAELIEHLSDPAGPQPQARRAFRQAHADLGKVFIDVERLLALPARLGISTVRFSDEMLAATALMALMAPLRADADRLHAVLSQEVRALLHPGVDDPIEVQLADAGCADPVNAAQRLRGWRIAPTDRDAFDALLPGLLARLGQSRDPDGMLATLDIIVARQPADIALSTSLRALIELLGDAPGLSPSLIAQPALIRRLIDGSASAPLPPPADLDTEFGHLIGLDDRQAGPSRIARTVEAHRFGLGLRLIERTADPLDLAAAHARLAEAALRAIAADALARMREDHGAIPESDLVILALGPFGAGALTSQSRLDLAYLFTGDRETRSDGRSPLDADAYYGRAAARISAAMATLHPIASWQPPCPVEGFDAEIRNPIALSRARPVYGPDTARTAALAAMRRGLAEPCGIPRRKPASGPYDVERVRGGLAELDLAVRLNQLGHHAGVDPKLRTAVGAQVRAGLLDPAAAGAHATLVRLLMVFDLLSPGGGEPTPEQRPTVARLCGHDHWDGLEADYGAARVIVQESWRAAVARTMATNG